MVDGQPGRSAQRPAVAVSRRARAPIPRPRDLDQVRRATALPHNTVSARIVLLLKPRRRAGITGLSFFSTTPGVDMTPQLRSYQASLINAFRLAWAAASALPASHPMKWPARQCTLVRRATSGSVDPEVLRVAV